MANLINPEIATETEVDIDFSKLTSDDNATSMSGIPAAPKKRGRPPKNKTKLMSDGSVIVDEVSEAPLSMWQSNQPYFETYGETTGLLRGTIYELEMLNADVKEEYNAVKGSKTMRNKYGYIKDLADTRANILGQKIRAIQEINSTITKAHDLDMKRYKDNKAAQLNEAANSEQRIFDMYNAFVNTPVGSYTPPVQFPTMQEMTLAQAPGSTPNFVTTDIQDYGADPGYAAYQQRQTPEQRMMTMQKNNPNIKTVVVYNQGNQTKRFEVRDTTTGQVIPGAPVPADYLLADTTININNGVARNANIDTVYPLVLEGMSASALDY